MMQLSNMRVGEFCFNRPPSEEESLRIHCKYELMDMLEDLFGDEVVFPDSPLMDSYHEFTFELCGYGVCIDLFAYDSQYGPYWYSPRKYPEIQAELERRAADDCDNNNIYYGSVVCHLKERADVYRIMKEQGANYVALWDPYLRDALVWIALGCPEGHDYDKNYSWLPERIGSKMKYDKKIKFTGTPSNLSMLMKKYQFKEIYKREIRLWDENLDHKGVPLQIFLYANRMQHLSKLPQELTDIEIMRGLSIAGVLERYTVFDASLMMEVLDKYDIKSVYDPCAGWGERCLCCGYSGIRYDGVDINDGLEPGYQAMISDLGLKNVSFAVGDSSLTYMKELHDAVITCPPYGNTEVYTEKGAENLDEIAFLEWWERVVRNCGGVKYFCFQINHKWLDRMADVVAKCGYHELERLYYKKKNRSSHFTRKKDGVNLKREYEAMLVFEKD